MVLSTDGKSQLLLDLLHGEGTTPAAGSFGWEVSGQLLQGLGSAWGLSVPKPTSRIPWGAKQRHWNLNPKSAGTKGPPERAQDWGQTSQKLIWTHCPSDGDHHSVLPVTLSHCFERGAVTLKSIF